MSNTQHEAVRAADRKRKKKSDSNRTYMRVGVTRGLHSPEHPVSRLVAEYEKIPNKQKSTWLMDLLLVGWEFNRYGMSEALAGMVRDRSIDKAGGIMHVADKLYALRGGTPPEPEQAPVKEETPQDIQTVEDDDEPVKPEPVQETPQAGSSPSLLLSDDDKEMGF